MRPGVLFGASGLFVFFSGIGVLEEAEEGVVLVANVGDAPAVVGEDEGVDDFLFRAEVLEGDGDEGGVVADFSGVDDEVLNIGVLGVVERVRADGTDFTAGGDGILPNEIGERPGEIGIDETAVAALEEGAFGFVLLVEGGDEVLGAVVLGKGGREEEQGEEEMDEGFH